MRVLCGMLRAVQVNSGHHFFARESLERNAEGLE